MSSPAQFEFGSADFGRSADRAMFPTQFAYRVKINVGGRMFETTLGTLQVAGKDSTLVKVVSVNPEPFFDRDPEPFAILLTMLRTGKVDDEYKETFPLDKLMREAAYYGLVEQLQTALSPDPLDGIKIEKQKNLTPIKLGNHYSFPLAPGSDGSVWVAHGKRITAYDWALRKGVTTFTELPNVQILERINDTHVVTGAGTCDKSVPLHIYDVMEGTFTKSLIWQDGANHPQFRAITSNDSLIFASCTSGRTPSSYGLSESPRFGAFTFNDTQNSTSCTSGRMPYSSVLLIDKTTMEIQRVIRTVYADEVGHGGTDCQKLHWLPQRNLLLEGNSTRGRCLISLWDIRSEKNVWQWKGGSHNEGFVDIVANEEVPGIFKLFGGSMSMCDMRNLTAEYPWLPLSADRVHERASDKGTRSRLISGHNKQLYVARGGILEVWSVVPLAAGLKSDKKLKYTKNSFRRTIKDYCEQYSNDSAIWHLAVGGNRLFVSRQSHVEVWESRRGV